MFRNRWVGKYFNVRKIFDKKYFRKSPVELIKNLLRDSKLHWKRNLQKFKIN